MAIFRLRKPTGGSELRSGDLIRAEAQSVQLGKTADTEVARAITPVLSRTVELGKAVDTEQARSVTPTQANTGIIYPASDTEVARTITPAVEKVVQVGKATDYEYGYPITAHIPKTVLMGQAVDTESARVITPKLTKTIELGQAVDTEAARAITPFQTKLRVLGQATETEAARSITPWVPKTVQLGRATDNELARRIYSRKPSVETGYNKLKIDPVNNSGLSTVYITVPREVSWQADHEEDILLKGKFLAQSAADAHQLRDNLLAIQLDCQPVEVLWQPEGDDAIDGTYFINRVNIGNVQIAAGVYEYQINLFTVEYQPA